MKKIIFCLFFLTIVVNTKAQIAYSHSAYAPDYLIKLNSSGYKYAVISGTTAINLYNLNHTLYKSIALPAIPSGTWCTGCYWTVFYISDNTFDLDNGIEYYLYKWKTQPTYSSNICIMDETGAVLFSKDSAAVTGGTGGPGYKTAYYNADPVYYDGTNTKLKVEIYAHSTGFLHGYLRTDIYDLPGSIPCVSCAGGITSFVSNPDNVQEENAVFFPNPVSDQLKLKYKLPEGLNVAEMKIYDVSGRLVDEFKVTDHYDFIYLPTNYNNGLYLYTLIVDGKIIKTEKIVLNK